VKRPFPEVIKPMMASLRMTSQQSSTTFGLTLPPRDFACYLFWATVWART
jgi:hypothetical protein